MGKSNIPRKASAPISKSNYGVGKYLRRPRLNKRTYIPFEHLNMQSVSKGGSSFKMFNLIGACEDNTMSMKLQVKGSGAPKSEHTAIIYQPDFEGIYTPFNENEPVWKGGRSNKIVGLFSVDDTIRFDPPIDIHNDFKFTFTLSGYVVDLNNKQEICRGTGVYVTILSTGTFQIFTSTKYLNFGLYQVSNSRYEISRTGDQVTITNLSDGTSQTLTGDIYDNTIVTIGHSGSNPGPNGWSIYDIDINGLSTPINEGSGTDIHDSEGNVVGALITTDEDAFWSSRVRNENGLTYSDDYDGNSLDPKPLMHYQPEATNLVFPCDIDVSTSTLHGGQVIDAVNLSSWLGVFHKSAHFQVVDTNSYVYVKYVYPTHTKYVLSVFVEMDDGAVPIVGPNASSNDFSIIMFGLVAESVDSNVIHIKDNIYQVLTLMDSGEHVVSNFGITVYSSQSKKHFKATGYQLFQADSIEEVENLGPILTETTAVSTDRIDYQYDIANLNNDSGAILVDVEPSPGLIAGTFLSYGLNAPSTNADFSDGETDWTVDYEDANNTITFEDGVAKYYCESSGLTLHQGTVTIGKDILYEFSIDMLVSGNLKISGLSKSYKLTTNGSMIGVDTSTSIIVKLIRDTFPSEMHITYFNVREFTGTDFGLADRYGNYAYLPGVVDTVNQVGARWHAKEGLMSLMVNGTWSADVPYSGKITNDFKLFVEGLNTSGIRCVKTHRDGTYQELKDVIDMDYLGGVYEPMESHPDWSLYSGVGPSPTKYIEGLKRFEITSSVPPDSFFPLMNSKYGQVGDVDMSFTAAYEGLSTAFESYLAVKGQNETNFVGVTIYNSHIRVYENSGGTWAMLIEGGSSVGAIGKRIRMVITGNVVELFINGVSVGTGTTNITGGAYMGIMLRGHPTPGGIMMDNFKFVGDKI